MSKYCFILYGLIIYELGAYLNVFHGVSPIVCGMIGCFCIIYNFIKIPKTRISNIGTDYFILVVLTILMFFRGSFMGNYLPVYGTYGFDTSFYAIFRHCFFDNYGIAYLIPLAAIIHPRRMDFSISCKLGVILCLVSMVLAAIHLPTLIAASSFAERTLILGDKQFDIRVLSNSVFIGSGFFVFFSFCFQLIRGVKKWVFPITMFVAFLCTVAGAGRGDSFIYVLRLFVFFYIWFRYPFVFTKKKGLSSLKMLTVFSVVVSGVGYLILKTDYFSFLFERLFDNGDAAAFAESGRDSYMQDLLNDFLWNPLYWLFGKGINGSYLANSDGGYMRDTIEWGFMQLILKGGILYLATYCFVLIKTAYMGIKKSRNLICKSFGFMCLIRVVELITFGHPSISVEFFLVWIGVAFIRNDYFRLMDNKTVKKYFKI